MKKGDSIKIIEVGIFRRHFWPLFAAIIGRFKLDINNYKKLDLASVQQQVGHRSLQTTQIYTRLTDEDVRKSYERVRYEE